MDNLLKFKIQGSNNNKIASTETMSKEDLTVSIIEEMVQKGENKSLISKIAAVTSKQNKGEVAELKSMLKL